MFTKARFNKACTILEQNPMSRWDEEKHNIIMYGEGKELFITPDLWHVAMCGHVLPPTEPALLYL